jgi:hypothetical protein
MPGELKQEIQLQIKNYKDALKYLEECGVLTLDKFLRINQMSGIDAPESKLLSIWEQADYMLPVGGKPGGTEALRQIMREQLIEGIATFEALADELDATD